MTSGQIEQFNCDGCGKSYRWKVELAGRRVKCKCGHAMTVPQPPMPIESEDPFADALSAMEDVERSGTISEEADLPRCPSCASTMARGATTCMQCGYNIHTGKHAAAKATVSMGVGGMDGFALAPARAITAKNAAPGGVLAYAGMPVRRSLSAKGGENAGDNHIGHPVKDLYLPIGLFLLGMLVTFCEARFGRGIADVTIAILYTAFTVVINLVLGFVGIMLAVKLLDLGLGPIGPALIKMAAVAILPGAVAGLLLHLVGGAGFFLVWVVSLSLTYGMFVGLLGLDFQETAICSTIIWAIRTWVGYALVALILSGFGWKGASGTISQSAVTAMSGSPTSKLKSPTPAVPKVTAAQLDARAMAAMSGVGSMEARAWVAAGSPNEPHEIDRFSDSQSPQSIIENLYAEGAQRVMITHVKPTGGTGKVARQFVFTLPVAKEGRWGLFGWGQMMTHRLGGTCQPDIGQKYLIVDLDGVPNPDENIEEDPTAGQ